MRFLSRAGSMPAALAIVATAAVACSDTTAPATAGRSRTVSAQTVAAEGFLVANAVKYRDAGKKPATGRSGNATLTVRALRAKDNTTLFEITTGSLDDASVAPGQLAKVQLKGLDPNDPSVALWTDNHNGLTAGGYASYTYPMPDRGMPVQVQANIRGIDPRTDVVTVVENVKLRPDLSPTALAAPQRARLNTPVSIAATVRELNGDVGARANCVLYVDDTEADRLNGMWVDAGGTVSCAFAHAFASTGTKALRIALESVVPGDWDPANNSVSGSIDITSANDFNYFAQVFSDVQTHVYHYRYDYAWQYVASSERGQWGQEYSNVGREQQAYLYGSMPVELPFPLTSVELSMASGGSSWHSASMSDVAPIYSYESPDGFYRQACTQTFSEGATGRVWFSLCTGHSTYDDGSGTLQTYRYTDLNYQRYAGDVVYWSSYYEDHYYADGREYHYSSNPGPQYLSEAQAPVGSDFRFSVDVSAGGATYHTGPALTLQPFEYLYSYPRQCYTYTGYNYTQESCSEQFDERHYVLGQKYGVPGDE